MLIATLEQPLAAVGDLPWLSQPTAAQIRRFQDLYWPDNTRDYRADLVCYVLTDGRLDACAAAEPDKVVYPIPASLSHLTALYRIDRGRYTAPRVRLGIAFSKLYDEAPQLVRRPTAAQLKAIRDFGSVRLLCHIDERGQVSECGADGPPAHAPGLEAAALKAAPLYAFQPAKTAGRPVATMAAVPVDFSSGFIITRPDWLKKPTGDDVGRAYPTAALRSGISGRAVIQCRVLTGGTLTDCLVQYENPPGTGFGEAALEMSSKFQMTPQRRDGVAVDDGTVTIPIDFRTAHPNGYGTSLGPPRNDSPFGPPTVKLLTWAPLLEAPTPQQVAAVFPAHAREHRIFGHAGMRCAVKRDGRLGDCQALGGEDPEGFDAAAMKLAPIFKVELGSVKPAELRDLYISVAFDFTERTMIPSPERYVRKPDWVRTLGPDDVVAAYPPKAVAAGVLSGAATVECRIGPTGFLQDCAAVSETPVDLGFGDAAAKVAGVLQANLWTRDGEPAAGAKIRLPMKFIYSEPPVAAAAPATAK